MKHQLFLIAIIFITIACKKETINTSNQLPVVTTKIVSDRNNFTAISGGNISSDAGSAIVTRGICWSKNSNPTITDSYVKSGNGSGSYNSNLTNLERATTYYVRAFATNSNGTSYGNQFTFKTLGVIDYSGNVYSTVIIGNQEWMMENLRTTKFNDGTDLNYISDWSTYTNSATAYTKYASSDVIATTYGLMYPFFTVSNPSKHIEPAGWKIPTNDDWQQLIDYLGGIGFAGGKMKETGNSHWNAPNVSATNSSDFTALPAGLVASTGTSINLNASANWWSSIAKNASNGYFVYISNNSGTISISDEIKKYALSVRCMRNI